MAFGPYPILSLADARAMKEEARRQLFKGIDPSILKAQRKRSQVLHVQNTFLKVSQNWWELHRSKWTTRHANEIWRSLERCIFPSLGNVNITEIDTPILLGVLQKIEKSGALETTHRIRQRIESIFNYAISTGVVHHNPAIVVRGALRPVPKKRINLLS